MNEETNTPGAGESSGYVALRSSGIHGRGAFAREPIRRGTAVIEYVGERISKVESLRRCQASNEYIFTLSDTEDLDGSVDWNAARFINHSCAPNCEAELNHGRIWIIALRDIDEGEELTFNYGYDLVDYQEHPCRCGTPECVGFIVAEEFFPHVRDAKEVRVNAQ